MHQLSFLATWQWIFLQPLSWACLLSDVFKDGRYWRKTQQLLMTPIHLCYCVCMCANSWGGWVGKAFNSTSWMERTTEGLFQSFRYLWIKNTTVGAPVWLSQLIIPLDFHSGHNLEVREIDPCMGVVLGPWGLLGILSPLSLSLPCLCSLSLKINRLNIYIHICLGCRHHGEDNFILLKGVHRSLESAYMDVRDSYQSLE